MRKCTFRKDLKVRRLHKAFLRWHDANNWPIIRDALRRMGRADLIGPGKHHLIPAWQPLGTGDAPEGRRSKHSPHASKDSAPRTRQTKARARRQAAPGKGQPAKPMKFRTQHTGLKGVRMPRSNKKGPPEVGRLQGLGRGNLRLRKRASAEPRPTGRRGTRGRRAARRFDSAGRS